MPLQDDNCCQRSQHPTTRPHKSAKFKALSGHTFAQQVGGVPGALLVCVCVCVCSYFVYKKVFRFSTKPFNEIIHG